MECSYVIEARNLTKKYKKFTLDIDHLRVPKGFATALIGENGAGKTTLLNILAGIRLDYKGEITYFGEYSDKDRESNPYVKENIGYTGPGNYYLPQWTIGQVGKVGELLFENFHMDRFEDWCNQLAVGPAQGEKKQKVSALSDGNRMKLMLAGVLARDTKLLLLDEPASPLDPLMRDRLCEMIQNYISEDEGNRSVFFSTHNVADMENITDYAIIMSSGKIVEAGFVEDLKEKYLFVKGEVKDIPVAKEVMYTMTSNKYGFEGICLAENATGLAGLDVTVEAPSLSQISVAVMKRNSQMEQNMEKVG